MTRTTILFGGTNKERLVSVASAQALHEALLEADLWFWDVDDSVHETSGKALLAHARPFEDLFKPDGRRVGRSIEEALDQAKADGRVLVLGLAAAARADDTAKSLYQAGKPEGKVVVWTPLEIGLYQKIAAAFAQHYPGIEIEA